MPVASGRRLILAAVRIVWLGLASLAFAAGMLLGVPIWPSIAGLICAAIPAIAGIFMRNSVKETIFNELETTLWTSLVSLGIAVCGAPVSILAAGYVIAPLLAARAMRPRLVVETSAFSALGYLASALVGSGGQVIDPTMGDKLAAVYGLAAVALSTWLIWDSVTSEKPAAVAPSRPSGPAQPSPAVAETALTQQLRQADERLARASAAVVEAREMAAKADAALEARTRFFAQTSHELRTPLGPITGYAEMMMRGVFGPLPEKYQDYAEMIHEAGRSLSLIVDDVLDLSRIEAGHRVHPGDASLTDIAADAVHFMQFEAGRKKVQLKLTDGEDVEGYVDPVAVRQILLNLISNALKFSPTGGAVTVSVFEAKGFCWLAVSDMGAGMTPEELLRMSRAFEQGGAGRQQKGSGLGLSVVRAFAELHGGGLEIESREGGGTTVAVFIPKTADAPRAGD